MEAKTNLKLDFELVPDGCWYSNLRSILKPAQWDIVRKEAYARMCIKFSLLLLIQSYLVLRL